MRGTPEYQEGVLDVQRGDDVDWNSSPRAAAGIEVNLVEDGCVIYDPALDRVHYLNHTAVLVLELCTGDIKAADLPGLVQSAYGLPEAPVQEIEACLDKLIAEGLLR
jgi:hypothetical protein